VLPSPLELESLGLRGEAIDEEDHLPWTPFSGFEGSVGYVSVVLADASVGVDCEPVCMGMRGER
jgi:hypothetical protein